ncbi:MAG: FHA domain-containing protein [Deltaproteobacteria bacterium]|jgi:hypothetical protein|nr:FHA domain-containing protein [Deltaproteobacteria bacterium]
MLIKICPCSQINKASCVLCEKCGRDLTMIKALPGSLLPKPPFPFTLEKKVPGNGGAKDQFAQDSPVKICPLGHVNPINAVICLTPNCNEDITLVPIVRYRDYLEDQERRIRQNKDPVADSGSKAPLEPNMPLIIYGTPSLFLVTEGGLRIRVRDGDIVGRQEVGAEYFQKFSTVSRRHARFFYRRGAWVIKNFSDNSSFLNDQRISSGKEKVIREGDILRLSSKCLLKVEIQ